MHVGKVLPEALQQLKDGESGCAACAGGRRQLLGPTALEIGTDQALGGGRAARCFLQAGSGWRRAVADSSRR